MSLSKTWAVVVLAFIAVAAARDATTPSIAVSGKPTFTTSNEGVRMLFVNPYDCEAPATTEATWVIELDESETVYSFQLAVTDANMIDNAELVTVRVGDSEPVSQGASSNSLCAVARLDASSAMETFECPTPLSGRYITVSRNDGGEMNVCGFSADLGVVAVPPAEVLAPSAYVPAAELSQPASPSSEGYRQADEAPVPASELPTLMQELPTTTQSFAANSVPVPAPGPGPALAPMQAILPVMANLAADLAALTPTPVPAPALAPTPALAPRAATQSLAALPITALAPGPVPTLAPTTATVALPSLLVNVDLTPTPAPAPGPGPVPSPAVAPRSGTLQLATLPNVPTPAPDSLRVTMRTPTPAPAPGPGPAALLATLPAYVPAPALARTNFVSGDQQPSTAASTGSTGSATTDVHKDSGLSGGAIAGIVIGCLAGVAIVASVAYVLVQRRNRLPTGGHRTALSSNPVYDA